MSRRPGREDYSRDSGGGGDRQRRRSDNDNGSWQQPRQQGGHGGQAQRRQDQPPAQQQQGYGTVQHQGGQAPRGNYQQQPQRYSQQPAADHQRPQQGYGGSQSINYSAGGQPAGGQAGPAHGQGFVSPQAAAAYGACGTGAGQQSAAGYGNSGGGDQQYRGDRPAPGPSRGQYAGSGSSYDRDGARGGWRNDGGGNRYGSNRDGGYGGHGTGRTGGFEGGRGPGRGAGGDRHRDDRRQSAPYQGRERQGGGLQLLKLDDAATQMRVNNFLLRKAGEEMEVDQKEKKSWPPQVLEKLSAARPEDKGTLGAEVNLVVNMFPVQLNPSAGHLLHYDVSFERAGRPHKPPAAAAPAGAFEAMTLDCTLSSQGSGTSGSAAAARRAAAADEAAAQAARNPKPPDNAREIILALEDQHWKPMRKPYVYAFDGAKNLVTVSMPSGEPALPRVSKDIDKIHSFEVKNIMESGRDKPVTWIVKLKLARQAVTMQILQRLPGLLRNEMRDREKETVDRFLQMWNERRQPLEWILKEILLARTGGALGVRGSLDKVNEFGRTMYFVRNPSNRNIGGGLGALAGLKSSVKLTESGLMFTADITASAFLRTDINLIQWMADVGGFNYPSGGGGGWGGGGGGRSVLPVGDPDVEGFLKQWQNSGQRMRLRINTKLRNKKVVYKPPHDEKNEYKRIAKQLSPHSAEQMVFTLVPKDGSPPQQMSVADYFKDVLRKPLQYPYLPVIEMKLRKNSKTKDEWIPPEFCWFDKNQRVQNVSHEGGTAQMIEAARKEPRDLAGALLSAVNPNQDAGQGAQLASGFGIQVDTSKLHKLKGRLLPGPWLMYGSGGMGRDADQFKALNTGTTGTWNFSNLRFSDPADLRSWSLVGVLQRRRYDVNPPNGVGAWVRDLVKRMQDLGMRLHPNFHVEQLLQSMIWVDPNASMHELKEALGTAQKRAAATSGEACQLVVCFIERKPSDMYRNIKLAAELAASDDGAACNRYSLGLVTQVVVAERTDLARAGPANRRSQYQANLCMKINTKIGGVNTKWALEVQSLLSDYFHQQQAPSLMVFGIDLTHPGRVEGGRSIAAVVGSLDKDLCKYGHQVWEEGVAGSEALSSDKLADAVEKLLQQRFKATKGDRPGCLIIYRDGVSDAELDVVRQLELEAIVAACARLKDANGHQYRPRLVYVVVQKRHNVRLLKEFRDVVSNLDPGTVVDHTIVSPWLFDFYLNSHKALIGTSRAARYICLWDELGFGADGLQTFTYWLCYLYCRCARSVSVVAPVYYAHLLAFRARMLSDDSNSDMFSVRSGSSGGSNTNLAKFRQYAPQLDGRMFFV